MCCTLCMTKRILIILLISLFGSFLLPKQAFACKKKTEKTENITPEKSCCKKFLKENPQTKKSCCPKNSSIDVCNGECNDCACDNTCSNVAFMLPFNIELAIMPAFIVPNNYFETKSYLSTGFLSVWTPPNIS